MNSIKEILENQKAALRICFVLMLVGGIIMSIMIPPWQTPDEHAHLRLIGESLKNESLAPNLLHDMDLGGGRIRFQYDEKINVDEWREAMFMAPGYDREECLPKGISASVIKHLPATVGIVLGVLLHLPTFWVMELGELFSLLFYLGVCWAAIKLMPCKKEVLLLFMAFPMALQQASSINYDAVLLPLCFLYISYIFYMRWEKERLVWSDVLCTLLLLLLITYVKIPYVFFSLLVFVLPKEKIHLKVGKYEINGDVIKKWRIPGGIVLLLLLAAGIYLCRDNYWLRLIIGMAMEWKRTLYLFGATAYTFGKYLMTSSVGQFGWLDSSLPAGFVVITYVLVIAIAVWGKRSSEQCLLEKRTVVYLWIVFGVLTAMILMSMVNHTITIILYGKESNDIDYNVREAIYAIPYIGGLQGRYFLPFLPVPFLTLSRYRKDVNWKAWAVALYIIIAITVTISVLYKRYWI